MSVEDFTANSLVDMYSGGSGLEYRARDACLIFVNFYSICLGRCCNSIITLVMTVPPRSYYILNAQITSPFDSS